METIQIGMVGFGQRGTGLLEYVLLPQKQAEVAAVCDLYEDRAQHAASLVCASGQKAPAVYLDYREMIADKAVNTVIIASSWESHVEIAVAAMKAGKAVAMEVGGAYTVEDCWTLVRTYEETKTPFMFLENCCFGRREMMVLHMVQNGVLGEIVHCSGGYHHDLRKEISFGKENRHYRLRNYLSRNCENYPTHELGPIARILSIGHGNRMIKLTSTASKSAGLHTYIQKEKPDDPALTSASFAQGDIVTTVIQCARGETIVLTLDTTLPRYYSRGFTVRGTKGMYEEATDSVFLDREEDAAHDFEWRTSSLNNAKEYEAAYEHPVWKQYLKDGVQGSHDGMDWLEFSVFFDCLKQNKPMPIDVYDAASWMAITALSEESIALGSAPVYIPDFTKGRWAQTMPAAEEISHK